MLLNNRLNPESLPDAPIVRVVFHFLKFGDRFRHRPGSGIRQVFFKCEDYMTIKREDGWLVRAEKGGFSWDKEVIKVV